MALIQLDHVSKFYAHGKTSAKGLDDVSLSFDKGDFVAITGESGSGKTTLLNVITLMDNYDEGDILFEGKSTADFSTDELLAFRRDYVSFVFQEYNIIPTLNAVENIVIALINKGIDRKEAKKKTEKSLVECGLKSRMHEKVGKLSGGERQRVVIARALALESPVIAFDEPTGNLDSATGQEIIALIDKIKEGRLILFVTHDYDSIASLANRHIVLENGRVHSDARTKAPYSSKAEPTKIAAGRKQNSFLALLLSGLALIFSAPKKLFMMCLSVILLSAAMVGFTIASSYSIDSISYNNRDLYDQFYPKAMSFGNENSLFFIGEDGNDVPDAVPQSTYYKKDSLFPYVNVNIQLASSRDSIGCIYLGQTIEKYVGLPNAATLLPGSIKEENRSGFYILLNEDRLGSSITYDFVVSYLSECIGRTSAEVSYFPLLSLPSQGYGNDSEGSSLSQCLDNLTFLGMAEYRGLLSAAAIVFTPEAVEEIDVEANTRLIEILSDLESLAYASQDFCSPFAADSLDSFLQVSFQGTPLRYGGPAVVTDSTDSLTPFLLLSSAYRGMENDLAVRFASKSYKLRDFYSLLGDLVDLDAVFGSDKDSLYLEEQESSDYRLNYAYVSTSSLPLFLLLMTRTETISYAFFRSEGDRTAAYKTFQAEKNVYPADLRYEPTSPPSVGSYILRNTTAILILAIFTAFLFVAFFITSPILSSLLKRYNPDFAVLTTLGYRERSLFFFRSIIVLVPMAMTFVILSAIAIPIVNGYNPDIAWPYLYLYFITLFLLLLFGLLLLLWFYRREKKRSLTNVLKDSGGQK